jgi:hypothetical protein
LEVFVKKVFAVLTFAALSSMTAFAAEWTGTISDAMCGAKHADASKASMECVQKCVKSGQPAVFVTSDNKVLKIDSKSEEKVMPHLGHKVSITGEVHGDTLMIESIKML